MQIKSSIIVIGMDGVKNITEYYIHYMYKLMYYIHSL